MGAGRTQHRQAARDEIERAHHCHHEPHSPATAQVSKEEASDSDEEYTGDDRPKKLSKGSGGEHIARKSKATDGASSPEELVEGGGGGGVKTGRKVGWGTQGGCAGEEGYYRAHPPLPTNTQCVLP